MTRRDPARPAPPPPRSPFLRPPGGPAADPDRPDPPARHPPRPGRTARRGTRPGHPRPRPVPRPGRHRGPQPAHHHLRLRHRPRRHRHRPRLRHNRPPRPASRGPAPPLVALPALINLTITTARLAQPRAHPDRRTTRTTGAGWALARPARPAHQGRARDRGTSAPRKPQRPPGDPDWCGPWTLTLPGGLELTVNLEPVPTYDCDHRNESHAYKPNETLRHLVQIRDHTCTFPPCNRHARESDFEHAVPYDQGGRTCACNAGAEAANAIGSSSHRAGTSPSPNPAGTSGPPPAAAPTPKAPSDIQSDQAGVCLLRPAGAG